MEDNTARERQGGGARWVRELGRWPIEKEETSKRKTMLPRRSARASGKSKIGGNRLLCRVKCSFLQGKKILEMGNPQPGRQISSSLQ